VSFEPAKVPRLGAGGVHRWRAGLWLLVALLVLAGCSTTATYVGTAQQGFYFKAPPHWTSYGTSALQSLGLPTTANNAQLQAQGSSYPVYTSFVAPVKHLGPAGLAGEHPWALGLVISLGGQDQVGLSLSSLQDEIFNVDGAASAGVPVAPLSPPKDVVKGALRGTLVSYAILAGRNSIAFEQEALVNSPTNKVWLLAAGCSPSCFEAHRSLIDRVIASFTVTAGKG
jgi:hypothetical protein